jgi:nucleotide-binding universal stress UspA family protein
MIERVVVPVDFSAESDRALVIAPMLAQWAGAAVELVTVATPDDRADIEPRLAAAAGALSNSATWRVVESGGPAEAVLLNEVHAGRKELWCVGSHARGKFSELFIKSVSEDLVRDAHMPIVLVGPHTTAAPTGRVLAVALDGSTESEAILPAAADLGMALGMMPRLLQVAGSGARDVPSDSVETGYLSRVAEKLTWLKREEADYDVLHGDDPVHSLADYVKCSPQVGMIALATRGLTGRARLTGGSTAFALAHRATVPVLILHHLHA